MTIIVIVLALVLVAEQCLMIALIDRLLAQASLPRLTVPKFTQKEEERVTPKPHPVFRVPITD